MSRIAWFPILILVASPPARAGRSEVADPGSVSGIVNSSTFRGGDIGTNLIGTSARELSCLMAKADPAASANDPDKYAQGLEKALKKIQFKPGTFTRTALLHFLSQILYETGHLATTEQKGNPPEDKKGYGMIQVTGAANMKACGDCVDECSPGDGRRMVADKSGTIGDGAQDKTTAALVSLCWWKMNMSQNLGNAKYANEDSKSASEAVTQIVNAGGVGREVTGGQKNLDERSKIYAALKNIDNGGTCRAI